MLLPKINKRVKSDEEAYTVYLGIMQAVLGFKITDLEKKILSVILKNGGLTKEVRKDLANITSKASVENTLSKLRAKKVLVGDSPNSKFPKLESAGTTITITLKSDAQGDK